MPGACSALATGRPGIAVPPGVAQYKQSMYEWFPKQTNECSLNSQYRFYTLEL